MASYTTNLNLKKPAGSENVSIGDINNNMDIIDTAYGTSNSNYKKIHFRVIKTYQNKTILPEGWVKLDDFATIVNEHTSEIANTWYIGSMNIRGWDGGTMPISIVKGSNGSDFYLLGKSGDTFTSVTVEYFLINPQAVTDAT